MKEVKTPKKPLLFYYAVALLVLFLFNLLAMPWLAEHQIKDVDYNTFVSMTEKKEIGQVEIQQQDNRILFTSTDSSFWIANNFCSLDKAVFFSISSYLRRVEVTTLATEPL